MSRRRGLLSAIINGIQKIFTLAPEQIGANWYFNNELSPTELNTIKIVCYGNSIMFRQLPSYIRASLKQDDYYNYEVLNKGENSKTGTQMIIDYPTEVAPEYDSTKDNYLFMFEFTNSLFIDGDTSEEAAQQLRDVATLAKATGFTVIIATATPAESTLDPLESEIVVSNTSIKNDFSPSDYNYDIRTNADFTTYDGTYFDDALHLNELGKQSYADSFATWWFANIVTYPIIDAVQGLNNQCITTPESAGSGYLDCGDTNWHSDPYFRHIFEVSSFTPHTQLGGRRNFGTLQTDWYVKIENDIIQFWIFDVDTTFRFLNFDTENLNTNEIIDLEAWYDVPGETMHIKANGVEVSQSCDKTVRQVSTALILHGTPFVNPPLRSHYIEVGSYSDLANSEKFYCENGQGDYVRGINGTLGEIKTIAPATMWAGRNKLEPYILTLGVTVYTNDGDSTLLLLVGDRSDVISGFTKDTYYPANSGIIKDLINEYQYPELTKYSDITDLQTAGIFTGTTANEVGFTEYDLLVDSDNVDITKAAKLISQLILK